MFKYRNLVRTRTRISDTEPKSDSEIPVWTPDSVHHKHKRHSSLNDGLTTTVPHTFHPCVCQKIQAPWQKRHPVAIWAAFDVPLETWCALEKPEATSRDSGHLFPRPDQSQSHLPAAAVQCCWTRPHRINQHQCGVCDEFTCVNDSWIALITLWWFSCVTLHRLSALAGPRHLLLQGPVDIKHARSL